jgi:hypothetical protein
LDNVYGISGWVGNPVREAYDLIVPIPHIEMPDGNIAFEFSWRFRICGGIFCFPKEVLS